MPRVKKVVPTKKKIRKKIVKPHAKAYTLHQTLRKSLAELKKYWSKQAASLKKQQTALTAKLKKACVRQKKIKTVKANELVVRFQAALEEIHQGIEHAKEHMGKYNALESAMMGTLEPRKKETPKAKTVVKTKGKPKAKAKLAPGKKRGRKPKAQEVTSSEDFDGAVQEEDAFELDAADAEEDFEESEAFEDGIDSEVDEMDEDAFTKEEDEEKEEDENLRF